MKVYILIYFWYPYQTGPAEHSIEFVYTDKEKAETQLSYLNSRLVGEGFWEMQEYEVEE